METNELFKKYSETKIMFINKITEETWKEWKKYNECSQEEKEKANLRQLFPNEVVLDLEDKNKLKEIIELLKAKKLFYEIWYTGSRGYHIHLFYNNLDSLDFDIRKKIRKIIIKEFNCDESKASEYGLIACFNRPHFKTGKEKTIIEVNEGINVLTAKEISFAENEITKEKSFKTDISKEDIEMFKNYFEKDIFWLWLNKNIEKLPEHCEFNNIVAKNLAIACIKSKKSNNEIEQIIKPFIARRKWYTYDEFRGYLKKTIDGELVDYNKFEINQWSKTFKYPIFYEEIEKEQKKKKKTPAIKTSFFIILLVILV